MAIANTGTKAKENSENNNPREERQAMSAKYNTALRRFDISVRRLPGEIKERWQKNGLESK